MTPGTSLSTATENRLVSLTPAERQMLRELLTELRRHVVPTEKAALWTIRDLLNKLAELELVP